MPGGKSWRVQRRGSNLRFRRISYTQQGNAVASLVDPSACVRVVDLLQMSSVGERCYD